MRDRGYKTINCKRPDSEGEDQPGFDDIERIAKEHGIAARRIPIELTGAGPGHHAAFHCAIKEMDGPFLIYCRSGTRSATLWQAYEMCSWDTGGPSKERRSFAPDQHVSASAGTPRRAERTRDFADVRTR